MKNNYFDKTIKAKQKQKRDEASQVESYRRFLLNKLKHESKDKI
jgi:hypothetical protein